MLEDDLVKEIEELKAQRNAIVLVHNYQPGEIHRIADFRGDSLELARKAAATDAEVIVFSGVHFMAETAAILSPQKIVVMPRIDAGCPMADMVDPEGLAALKAKHPDAVVVTYVNSTAAVKALSDVCCTSANAVKVVNSIPADREVIFVPDQYLAMFVERLTGRELVKWPGFCPVHVRIRAEDIERARERFPEAEIWTHPECLPEASSRADYTLSTGQMVKRSAETEAKMVVVATEVGMLYRLREERPDVTFVPATEQAVCVNMKLPNLHDVRRILTDLDPVIDVPEEIRRPAVAAVQRMLELA
ncbi:MAG: quinolinate synthase NadA [Deltaproteobacteria bacterium]|nr:quinolinate synthase NadA [Deltaproteobacteria bacterium]